MLVQQPLPLWLTAAGFLAKYGTHDDYDFVPLLPRLTCPTLLIVGTASVESSPAFASVLDAVRQIQALQPSLELRLVPGANTGYSGYLYFFIQFSNEFFFRHPFTPFIFWF